MNAKNIRMVGILWGAALLFVGAIVERKWVKTLLLILGAVNVVGNVLAKDQMYEEIETQINEQMNKGEEQE